MDTKFVWITAFTLVLGGCGSDSGIGDSAIDTDAGIGGSGTSTGMLKTGGRVGTGGQTNLVTSTGGVAAAGGASTQVTSTNSAGGLGAAGTGGASAAATSAATLGGTTAASSTSATTSGGVAASGGAQPSGGHTSTGGVTATTSLLVASGGSAVSASTATTGGAPSIGGATGALITGGTSSPETTHGNGGHGPAATTAVVTGGAVAVGGSSPVAGSAATAGTCATVYYRDADKDSWGSSEASCVAEAGWVTRTGDCDDSNADVFPGQTTTFAVPYSAANGSESFDYNCDGTESLAGGIEVSTGQCESSGSGNSCQGEGYLPLQPARTGTEVNQVCGSSRYLVCARSQQQCVGTVMTDDSHAPATCR